MTDLAWENVSDADGDVDAARETAEGAVRVFRPNECVDHDVF